MSDVVVRTATPADVPAICRIYNDSVLTDTASWDVEPEPVERRAAWLEARRAAGHAVVVAEVDGVVVGYGAWGPFRDKAGYARTMEHSVYVDAAARRRGVGHRLLEAVVATATDARVHVLVGALSADNEPSLRLHEAHGFVEVGRLPQAGAKFGRWLDLVLVQRVLDEADPPPGRVPGASR